MRGRQPWRHSARVLAGLAMDLVQCVGASLRSRTVLAAENLFLRKQLALYRERRVKPRRASESLRRSLVLLARGFAWREARTLVQPAMLLRWHRNAFRRVWRWRARSGRPRLPAELPQVSAVMARDNPTLYYFRREVSSKIESPRRIRRSLAEDRNPASPGGSSPDCPS